MDGKILLVDDEQEVADLIKEALRQDSFRDIRKAYTGTNAINGERFVGGRRELFSS